MGKLFPVFVAPVSPAAQNGTDFYLLPNRAVSKARLVLAECLGIPGKPMPGKGRVLSGLKSRGPGASAIVFRLCTVVNPFKNMQKPARPPIKQSDLIIHKV